MISFIINALIIMVIPKLIGTEEYGLFQYYTLIAAYAAYFHLGICNGIVLKDAGKNYSDLNKGVLSSQHLLLIIIAGLIFAVFQIFSVFYTFGGSDKLYILRLVSFVIIFVNSRVFSTSVLLMSSRFKEYSRVIIIEKVIYALFLVIALVAGVRAYNVLILGDIFGKIFASLLGVYYCRDIVFAKFSGIGLALKELWDNFRIGVFVLVTNISSILITGIIQFFVEDKWDMETFGKVSFSFSISKLLMTVINAVSLVLFPFLKNVKEERLPEMYKKIRLPLSSVLILLLAVYYPMKWILGMWLPQYNDSLYYASVIFPMCLFESKTALLVNTYLKALRKEKWLCFGNLIIVAACLVSSLAAVYGAESLMLTVALIPFLLAARCIILELAVSKVLKISVVKETMFEIMVSVIFIAANFFLPDIYAFAVYAVAVLVYMLIHKAELKSYIGGLRKRI